jgi:hypothetical protein
MGKWIHDGNISDENIGINRTAMRRRVEILPIRLFIFSNRRRVGAIAVAALFKKFFEAGIHGEDAPLPDFSHTFISVAGKGPVGRVGVVDK